MPLSDENRNTLLIYLHKSIEESSAFSAHHIFQGSVSQLIDYPPNGGLTGGEQLALEDLKGNEILHSALRKVFASTTAGVLFDFFSVVDHVADPDAGAGAWTGVRLEDLSPDNDEDAPFLHDEFYSTYWDWQAMRKDTGWSLNLPIGPDAR